MNRGVRLRIMTRSWLAIMVSVTLCLPLLPTSRAGQLPLLVLAITPANNATGVSTRTTIVATFSQTLIAETVNRETFLLIQPTGQPVAGIVTATGPLAVFAPLQELSPNTSYRVLIRGGPNGVAGGLFGFPSFLVQDFTSRFTTGSGGAGDGTEVTPEQGGTVTDPRRGSAIIIPPNTLRVTARVRVLTLDTLDQQINNDCGVPIRPGEELPGVPGFERVTEVVRYEADPCGVVAFAPGGRLLLPLIQQKFPIGLPIRSTAPFRLFELSRRGGRLQFLDTGIAAKLTSEGGTNRTRGNFVTTPDIQIFGTFAAFRQISQKKHSGSDADDFAVAEATSAVEQNNPVRLYFPVISQGSGRATRISIANPDTSANVDILFRAYRDNGTLAGTQLRTVNANRQASFLVSDLFPTLTSGAIIAERQAGGALTGFYEIADSFTAPNRLSGAEAATQLQTTLLFPVVKSLNQVFTEVHVFNPHGMPVNITLSGFTAAGTRVPATNAIGQPLTTISLSPFEKLIVYNDGSTTKANVRLDFTNLDGGYVFVQSVDAVAITGGELFGEMMSGQMSLALLNSLPFPRGCLPSSTDPCACQVGNPATSPVPSALHQHTMYAPYFENDPASSIIYLVNVSEHPAELGFRVYGEDGQFRASFPPTGFLTIAPHQVFQADPMTLFGFNPSPGYVRVEDQNSAFVGGLINRNTSTGRFATIIPLIPDDPQITQIPTSTYFSRVQIDPASANPRQTTGMLVMNPTLNSLQFRIRITTPTGQLRQSSVLTAPALGAYTLTRLSLATLFSGLTLNGGYANVLVTTVPGPGQGGRVIPVATYRTSQLVSTVQQQNQQP
ncbi:MAG: Ig-like domain-containing protein [Acidobacteriota bacterium]|nr:Ig-like domain-containing protein [Blastocatellia bacterium]MDW8240273.1 Ig-like domain-containing protein [Acidobacteriota bacterium]